MVPNLRTIGSPLGDDIFLNYRQVLLKMRKPQSGSLDVPLCHLSVHNKLCGYLNIHRESQGQEKRKEKKEEWGLVQSSLIIEGILKTRDTYSLA